MNPQPSALNRMTEIRKLVSVGSITLQSPLAGWVGSPFLKILAVRVLGF